MPLSPSPRIASIMSCRCIEGPQLVVTGAVGDRRMAQRAVLGGDDRERPRWFAAPRQDVEDQIVARRAGCQCLAHGRLDWPQAIGQSSEERRFGKVCCRTGRCRWWPDNLKKQKLIHQ